ncbi:MAG: hotdog fold thioesterase [Bacteroidia bacterium]|nr:hotdog fold thioesterase [Bacteroidia bacterium]
MPDSQSKAQAIYEKMMEKDYCSQWLGIKPILIEEGHCQIGMKVRQEMLNGHGILHGGIAFTFADSAFAFASNSYGRLAVSIQGSMNYAKSAKEGDELIAEATALNVTHKTADFDVKVLNKHTKEVLYYFRGTVYRSSREILGD